MRLVQEWPRPGRLRRTIATPSSLLVSVTCRSILSSPLMCVQQALNHGAVDVCTTPCESVEHLVAFFKGSGGAFVAPLAQKVVFIFFQTKIGAECVAHIATIELLRATETV